MPVALWNFAIKSAFPPGYQNLIKLSTRKAAVRIGSFLLQLLVHSLCWPHVAHSHAGLRHCLSTYRSTYYSTYHRVKPFASKKPQADQRPDSNKAYFSGTALQASTITMDVNESQK